MDSANLIFFFPRPNYLCMRSLSCSQYRSSLSNFLKSFSDSKLAFFCFCHSLEIRRSQGLSILSCLLREWRSSQEILLSCINKIIQSLLEQYTLYNNRIKMKQNGSQLEEVFSKLSLVEGPPLDFSFKGIRALEETLKIVCSLGFTEQPEEAPKAQLQLPKSSEKEIGQLCETRLNIIRTIDLDEGKADVVKQFINKKTDKVATKVVQKAQFKTTSLFLRYNKLKNTERFLQIVQQLLPGSRWQQLVWLDLSHNRLTLIDKEWQFLPQLKNLYLHVNYITNFKEFEKLQGAKLLRTFTIHGNPIQNYPQFRALLVSILPQLQKLDSALLTKREKERGEIIKKQAAKYPVIINPAKLPEQSEEQQQG